MFHCRWYVKTATRRSLKHPQLDSNERCCWLLCICDWFEMRCVSFVVVAIRLGVEPLDRVDGPLIRIVHLFCLISLVVWTLTFTVFNFDWYLTQTVSPLTSLSRPGQVNTRLVSAFDDVDVWFGWLLTYYWRRYRIHLDLSEACARTS